MDKDDDVTLNFGEEEELDRRQKFKYIILFNTFY